ncbi:hypothetical protein DV451_002130 [Geotrichum candidum]|uniref:CTLH domain-containing protein n=1 Tax=Geotrichum candidum TaxID=1173061 RepID=A0A9P5G6D7_GEOCN|nr:hypothetical protein DV451_002130 [Geotrichum candidum]KAF5110351.1 hypothetical protein DV453_001006 [Geotrichum candidum]
MYKKSSLTASAGAAAGLTGNKKRKLEYSKEEWDALLSTIPVTKRSLDALVMDYLIIEGYQSTAQKFAHEANLLLPSSSNNISEGDLYNGSNTGTSNSNNSIDDTSSTSRTSLAQNALLGHENGTGHDLEQPSRMAIKSLILSGQIQAAIELINDVNPELLDTHKQLHFDLLRLQLVELIRAIPAVSAGGGAELTSDMITPVLDFAARHLAKRAAAVPRFLAELEQTMALLCMNPTTAPKTSNGSTSNARSSLLDLSLRTTVAQDVNTALLEAQGLPNESKITDLVKLWGWTERELGNRRITVDNDLFS